MDVYLVEFYVTVYEPVTIFRHRKVKRKESSVFIADNIKKVIKNFDEVISIKTLYKSVTILK